MDRQEGNQAPNTQQIGNQTPVFVKETFFKVILYVEKYGWFFLFGAIAILFLWFKLRPHYKRWKKKREEEEDLKKFDMNKAVEQQQSMDKARLRMQEIYNNKAMIHSEEMKKREEERRQELIEDWENHRMGKGYKSKLKNKPKKEDTPTTTQSGNVTKPKKPFRPLRDNDYSPLSGGGGGSSYRPSPRGGRGGG